MQESNEKTTLLKEINKLKVNDCKDILEILTQVDRNDSFSELNDVLSFFYTKGITMSKSKENAVAILK